uniref:Putative lambdoid prophage Qin defective integrase n=1 Tax=Erwinia amylovora ATCC BAA-2158 TaxID=889211 RepID=E5B5H5_ERWAM|nr:putative lambdoid prophage Qin defective integrase [Erwinia amylovora ATCC BAA-2158]
MLAFAAGIRTIRDILLPADANPSFIADQMGHENGHRVYEVYGTWTEELNGDRVLMLNKKLAR